MTNPSEAAMYLTYLKNEAAELKRLEMMHSADVRSLRNPEIAGLLRVAIGKTKLLLTKKGEQFRDFCESHNAKKENELFQITNDDLAAFWEIIVAQITDIKKIYSKIADEKQTSRKVKVMPKKFSNGNTKAVAAKARKAAAKEVELDKKKQELEDALWQDDDKNVQRKQQRKDEKERKKQELLDKKASAKALLERELADIKPTTKQPAAKVFRAQIQEELEKRQAASQSTPNATKSRVELPVPLVENINHTASDGIEARTITEAIEVLSCKDKLQDKHPERRVKAALAAFEEKMMPIVKNENPSLRFTQLKQIIYNLWQKSEENPMNQKED